MTAIEHAATEKVKLTEVGGKRSREVVVRLSPRICQRIHGPLPGAQWKTVDVRQLHETSRYRARVKENNAQD